MNPCLCPLRSEAGLTAIRRWLCSLEHMWHAARLYVRVIERNNDFDIWVCECCAYFRGSVCVEPVVSAC